MVVVGVVVCELVAEEVRDEVAEVVCVVLVVGVVVCELVAEEVGGIVVDSSVVVLISSQRTQTSACSVEKRTSSCMSSCGFLFQYHFADSPVTSGSV